MVKSADMSDGSHFDLVIVKSSRRSEEILKPVFGNGRGLLLDDGYILFVEASPPSLDLGPDSDKVVIVNGALLGGTRIISLLESNGFHCIEAVQFGTTESVLVSVAKPSTDPTAPLLDLSIVSLVDTKVAHLDPDMKAALEAFG